MVVYFRIGFSCKSSLFVMMIPQLFDTLLQFVSLLRLNHLISLLSAVVPKITTSNKQTTEQTNDNMPCIVGVFFSKFMITMKYLDERVFFAYAFCTGNKVSVAFCRFKIYKICNLILKNNHVFVWFELLYFTMWNVMKKKLSRFPLELEINNVAICTRVHGILWQCFLNSIWLSSNFYLHNDYEMSRFIPSRKHTHMVNNSLLLTEMAHSTYSAQLLLICVTIVISTLC